MHVHVVTSMTSAVRCATKKRSLPVDRRTLSREFPTSVDGDYIAKFVRRRFTPDEYLLCVLHEWRSVDGCWWQREAGVLVRHNRRKYQQCARSYSLWQVGLAAQKCAWTYYSVTTDLC